MTEVPLPMLRKKQFLFAALLFSAPLVHAQTASPAYQIPVSSGTIDGRFVLPVSTTLTKDVLRLKNAREKVTPEQEDYMAETWADLSRFLQAGSILTGDEMSNYVNRIAAELTRNEPELKGKVKLVINRNPGVSAGVFDQGVLYINIGMLAQVENEAQLAFVIGRQLLLYKEQHSLSRFKKRQQLIKEKKMYGDELREAMREDSKERQKTADRECIRLMKSAGYSLPQSLNALDVILYSYVPFDDVAFEPAIFEDKNLKFPESYILKETRSISADDDFDDSNNSFPNIRKRKEALQTEIDKYKASEEERKKFVLPETDFRRVQHTARYEVCRQYDLKRNFPQAIYTAFMLQKKNPGDDFLNRIITGSLYNLAVYRLDTNNTQLRSNSSDDSGNEFNLMFDNNSSGQYYLPSYEKVEGQSQRVYYLISKMTPQEMAAVAMNYAWKRHREMPDDKFYSRVCDRLFALMAEEHNLSMSSFATKSREAAKADAAKDTTKEASKYDKIKKQQRITDVTGEDNFAHYAFVDFAGDTAFTNRFRDAVKNVEESKRLRDEEQERKRNKEPVSLGVDKIIVIDPLWADVNAETNKRVILTREKEQDMVGAYVEATAKKLKLECVLLDANRTDTLAAAAYNDFCAIKEMMSARMEHGITERTLTGQTTDCKKIIEKYGTSLCLWPCAVKSYSLFSSQTVYYSILVDLEDGEWVFTQTDVEYKAPSVSKFKKHIQNALADIKRPAKK